MASTAVATKSTGWGAAHDDRVAAVVAEEVKKHLSPVEALLKDLEKPASRAGLSPQEFLAKMTAGGRTAAVFGSDGSVYQPNTHSRGLGNVNGKSFGQFLSALCEFQVRGPHASKALSVLEKDFGTQRYQESSEGAIIKTALAESSGVTGGYSVPPMFATQLQQMVIEESIVAPRATHMPMTSLTLSVPSLDVTTSQGAGNTPFLGGVKAKWTSEAATRTETEPTFRQTELKANELSFYTVASNTLLADNAIGLDTLLTQLFKNAIAWYTDYAYLQGTGVGQPMGVVNAPAAIAVNRSNANKIDYKDVAAMYAKMYFGLARLNSLTWIANQSTIPQFLQMNDGLLSASSSTAVHLTFQPFSQGAQAGIPESAGMWSFGQLFGIPLIISEKLPALGTKGDLILVDWSKYLLGDRMDLMIDVSPHVNFLQNQMVWRVVWRGDGQPWLNSSITLADGSTTVSPFVVLN
jgi:HK97 family phage major capsid protein